jgi:hypothetical protein
LSELDADSTVLPEGDRKINADLIFDDGVPDVFCDLAHRMRV